MIELISVALPQERNMQVSSASDIKSQNKGVFDFRDLVKMQAQTPLHSNIGLEVVDSGDFCDSDCQDCD
jgi:hypothetical protein